MMTLLIAIGTLLILALIVAISATRKSAEKADRMVRAKLRAEMRSNATDVWEASSPTKVRHTDAPIEYIPAVHVEDDVTDSQYQILKSIFADIEPTTPTQAARLEADFWRDTEPGRFK
jgi:hypothetical protein